LPSPGIPVKLSPAKLSALTYTLPARRELSQGKNLSWHIARQTAKQWRANGGDAVATQDRGEVRTEPQPSSVDRDKISLR